MRRSISICIVLAGLVTLLSIQVDVPERSSLEAEVSGYVPFPPETEFSISTELEKTRFSQSEEIRVWLVTELGSGEHRAIPDLLLDRQQIIFTRPDGSTRIDRKPIPIDHWELPGAHGSRYAHTLKGETPQLGRWSVVFEVGSRRTAPAEFIVEARRPSED